MKKLFTPFKNERGILTLDLVFALSLTLGGMIIVLALTLTFSSIEVAQYIAFSVSRAYYPAHISQQKQEDLANRKYAQLTSKNSPLRAMLRPGWFDVQLVGVGDFKSEYEDNITGSYSPFDGAEVRIIAKLLSFNIPFFGRTSSSDSGLQTKVNSYLGREPSTAECKAMVEQRWQKIKANVGLGGFNIGDTGYYTIMDDGC